MVLNTSLNAPARPIAVDTEQVLADVRSLGIPSVVCDGVLWDRPGLRLQKGEDA